MHRLIITLALVVAATSSAFAQNATPAKKPPHAMVSLYRIATGKQLDFLKWMAAREAIDKEVGIAATQWYAHVDGDSWDYMAVGPVTSSDQDDKVEAALKKHGLTTGFKQSLEVRQFFASHTDTLTVGPVSAGDLVDTATK
jgi:hypothetical protein